MRFDEMFNEMQKYKVDASFISSPRYDGVYKWHKTTDQLPPVGCYVLGYVECASMGDRYFALVKRVESDLYRFISTQGNKYDYGIEEVTHWTHLPNAPTQEETE